MRKNNSFIWFLVFALYCMANTVCIFGLVSLPLVLVTYLLCCACSGKNAMLTVGISAVFATAALILSRGVFGLFVFMLIIAFCLAFSHAHSFGYTKTAFTVTVAVCLAIVSALLFAVYASGAPITPEGIIGWLSDGFDQAGRLYMSALSEAYGSGLEEIAGLDVGQMITIVKTASMNMMTGTVLLIASLTALAGTALSYKVRYGKVSLLDTYTLSLVGGIITLVSLVVFSTAGGRDMIIAGNIYMAFMPWFAVLGIKALRKVFVKKQPVSIFTVVTVAIIAFSFGITAALVYLGVTDNVRGLVKYEK